LAFVALTEQIVLSEAADFGEKSASSFLERNVCHGVIAEEFGGFALLS
jgi:hypothetical protein